MNPPHPPEHQRQVVLDLASATGYLAATRRPDITIETALIEAIRRHIASQHVGRLTQWGLDDDEWFTHAAIDPNDPDPLRTALDDLAAITPAPDQPHGATLATVLIDAIDAWTNTMAEQHNRNWPWPHPTPVQGWQGLPAGPDRPQPTG